jgi:hypothetical protein
LHFRTLASLNVLLAARFLLVLLVRLLAGGKQMDILKACS